MKIHKIQLYGQGNCGPGYARWARLSVRNSHWLSHDMFQYGDTLKWLLKCWKIRVNLGSLKSIYLDFSDKAWQTYMFWFVLGGFVEPEVVQQVCTKFCLEGELPKMSTLEFSATSSLPHINHRISKVQETLRIHKDSKGQRYVVDTTFFSASARRHALVRGFGSLMTPWPCFTGWIDSMHPHQERGHFWHCGNLVISVEIARIQQPSLKKPSCSRHGRMILDDIWCAFPG